MLKETSDAPNFKLLGDDGKMHSLSDQKGSLVVVYFYPKDDTPGCTKQACDFRDNMQRIASQGCKVFGISKDSTTSHTKFKSKYDLNFILLSDPETKTHQDYQVLEAGKTIRSTFLIDKTGKIAKIWSKVKVPGHVDEVLNSVSKYSK